MELEAAKMIGAGLAAIALAGAGIGIRLRACRSYWFVWIGCCINNFICILINVFKITFSTTIHKLSIGNCCGEF